MSTTASGHTIEERKTFGDNVARATREQLERRWGANFQNDIIQICSMGNIETWVLVQGKHNSPASKWELKRE